MKANNIEELFGTLQQSVVASWRKHLKTDKYSAHMALDEFYKEMPELVDALIENWMGDHGKVDEYINILDSKEISAIDYLEELLELTKSGRDLLEGDTSLESDMDAIIAQIKSTLYKLKELKESRKSLVDALNESVNEDKLRHFSEEEDELKGAVYDALESIANKFTRKYHIDKGDMETAIDWFMMSYYD